jgi:vacuolar-type H+-ATPase subunit D/Vma8
MRFQQTIASSSRVERRVYMKHRVAFVHSRTVAVERRYGSILEEIGNIKQLLEVQSMFLAVLGVRTNVVQLAKLPSKSYMPSIVEAGIRKLDDTILSFASEAG